jgi:hypothetical protein
MLLFVNVRRTVAEPGIPKTAVNYTSDVILVGLYCREPVLLVVFSVYPINTGTAVSTAVIDLSTGVSIRSSDIGREGSTR